MIQIQSLNKRFGEKVIFDQISYHFPTGERIALVGANGAGKTTLLNCICHLEEVDSGHILIPQSVKLGYLPQEPNPRPKESVLEECLAGAKDLYALKQEYDKITKLLSERSDEKLLERYEEIEAKYRLKDGYSLESKALSILEGLGFSPDKCRQSPTELSGGWRMRLELAKLFLDDIDFLILDEPTNHLDLPTLVWVENFLNQFRGTLLFVSHDRALLNRLSTITLYLNQGRLSSYSCAFDRFLEQKDSERELDVARLENLEKKREHLEKFVERFGAKASKARQAQSRVKMISRLRALEDNITIESDPDLVTIKLPNPPKSARKVVHLEQLEIGYQNPLFSGLNLSLERGQKVAVIGANGIGKSTLLKTIVDRVKPLGGYVEFGSEVYCSYFSQNPEDSLDLEKDILTNVLDGSNDTGAAYARSLLGAFLFRSEEVYKPVRVLSGGEKSRVALAKLLIQKANFLILDEPTNHLDMGSVEALAQALESYQGTVIFVSHDRNFIDAVCSHVFVMLADGRNMLFEGKLEDYERLSTVSNFPNLLTLETSPSPSSIGNKLTEKSQPKNIQGQDRAKELKSRRQSLLKQIAKLEQTQENLNQEIQKIESKMSELAGDDYQKVYELQSQLNDRQDQLSTAEEEWLIYSNELEEVEAGLVELGRLK